MSRLEDFAHVIDDEGVHHLATWSWVGTTGSLQLLCDDFTAYPVTVVTPVPEVRVCTICLGSVELGAA